MERVRYSDMTQSQNAQDVSAKTNMSTGRRLIPVTESLHQAVKLGIILKIFLLDTEKASFLGNIPNIFESGPCKNGQFLVKGNDGVGFCSKNPCSKAHLYFPSATDPNQGHCYKVTSNLI